MKKFCEKCGSPLDEQGQCPYCDKLVFYEEPDESAGNSYEQPRQQTVQVSSFNPAVNEPDEMRKKPQKKGLIIAVIAAVLVVCIACGVFAYFAIFKNGKSTNTDGKASTSDEAQKPSSDNGKLQSYSNECITRINGKDVYIGGTHIFPADYIEYGKKMTVDKAYFESLVGRPYPDRSASDGKTMYALLRDDANQAYLDEIYKITGRDGNYKKEVWVNEETLKKADIGPESDGKKSAEFFAYPLCYKEYVYFINYVDDNYIDNYYDVACKIGKISKDGKSIKFIEGIRAEAFTIADDWIYYYDNGIEENSLLVEYDTDRAGIYRAKLDGSNKQLLYKPQIKNTERGEICELQQICSLRVDDKYLYYKDNTDDGEGRLFRIKTNGNSKPQCITEQSLVDYTFDPDSSAVYYLSSEQKEGEEFPGYMIYKTGKSGGNDIKIESCPEQDGFADYYDYISFDNGYIYFCSIKHFISNVAEGEEPTNVSGLRYDVKKKEFAKLYAYRDTGTSSAGYEWIKE